MCDHLPDLEKIQRKEAEAYKKYTRSTQEAAYGTKQPTLSYSVLRTSRLAPKVVEVDARFQNTGDISAIRACSPAHTGTRARFHSMEYFSCGAMIRHAEVSTSPLVNALNPKCKYKLIAVRRADPVSK
jgi:hypothetical protein